MSAKQDNVGYCINITPGYVNVLKFSQDDPVFNNANGKRILIKSLVDFYGVENPSELLLEGVYHQFSDTSIDIFVDDESLVKGYPLTARTSDGTSLHGNLAIVGSNGEGDSILLTKSQVELVLEQLHFPNNMQVEVIDLFPTEVDYGKDFKPSKNLDHLLKVLVNYCHSHDLQLITRGRTDDEDEGVFIVCLLGNRKSIEAMHADFVKLVKSGKYRRL